MVNKTSIGLVALSIVSLILLPSAFAAPNMKEGMWEIKGEMKVEGLSFPVPPIPVNYSQCLTKKDMIPQKKEQNRDCKMITSKMAGDTVTWTMQCKDKYGITDSTGTITYKGNSFTGTVNSVTKDSQEIERSKSTLQMSGKRTGACK